MSIYAYEYQMSPSIKGFLSLHSVQQLGCWVLMLFSWREQTRIAKISGPHASARL
jgi:hypothetical protein